MAMQTEEILKIIADVDPAIKNIDQLEKKLEALRAKAKTIDFKADPQGYEKTQKEITKLEIAQSKLKNSTSQMSAEMRRASGEVKGFGDAAAVSGGVAIALGQALSDIGQFGFGKAQGIRAIANNISQLATLFSIAVAQAGSFKKAIQGVIATMRGPLGIVVVIQAVVGALDLWASSQRKAKEESDELLKSMKLNDSAAVGMYNAYKQMNPATEEARKLKKALGDELKVNIDNYKDLDDAIEDHIRVLELESDIRILLNERAEISAQRRLLERENLEKLIENQEVFQDQNEEALKQSNLIIENSPQLLFLKGEEARLTAELSEKYGEMIPLLKEEKKAKDEDTESTKKSKKALFEYNTELDEYRNNLLEYLQTIDRLTLTTPLSEEAKKVFEIDQRYEELFFNLEAYRAANDISEQEYLKRSKQLHEAYYNEIQALRDKDLNKKKDSDRQQELSENKKMDAIFRLASATFGFLIALNQALAGESEEERKKAFKRDKALRSAQVVIDTARGVSAALATAPPNPILAAAIGVQGAANLATILGTQYNGESTSATTANVGGIQGGYPYPMSGFSTIQPQFPDRTGSLEIIPRVQRIVVVESDITDAQKAQVDRGYRASVGG